MLRGARQVGKSTLVRRFAEINGLVLNEINLEQHLFLDTIFKILDIESIIRELEALLGRNIQAPGSLLFLDEIQATPTPSRHFAIFTKTNPGFRLFQLDRCLNSRWPTTTFRCLSAESNTTTWVP